MLKRLFLDLLIVSCLKDVIVPIDEFDRELTIKLFGKLYDTFPEKPCSKEEYLQKIDKWLNFYRKLVDFVWYLSPDLMHSLTWAVVKTQQKAWMEVVNWLMRWAEETKEEIQEKINYYSKEYNEKVLEALIQKDYEIYINRYNEYWERKKKEAIDDLMQKQGDDNEPDGSFPYWIDEDGWHYKGGKK
jgi:hypothetical protein